MKWDLLFFIQSIVKSNPWLKEIDGFHSVKFINLEYDSLKEQYDKNVKVDEKIKNLFSELKEINTKLWDIEDKLRIYEKNKDFGKDFIELARGVYFNNDKRSRIKLEINKKLNSNITEIKEYVDYEN